MKNKKQLIFKILHCIGYISTFIVLIFSIILGVQSCNGQENRQDKPIQNIVTQVSNYDDYYSPHLNKLYVAYSYTGSSSSYFNYAKGVLTSLVNLKILDANSNGDSIFDDGYLPCEVDITISGASSPIRFTSFTTNFSLNEPHHVCSFSFRNDSTDSGFDFSINLANGSYTSHTYLNSYDVPSLEDKLMYAFRFYSHRAINKESRNYFIVLYSLYKCNDMHYSNVTIKPYIDLSNYAKGVYYPLLGVVRTTNYATDISINRDLFGFYIDYDDTIYGVYYDTTQKIGTIEYDSNDTPYFNYYRYTNFNENTYPYNGVLLDCYLLTTFESNNLNEVFVPCSLDVNNNIIINFDEVKVYFNWYQYQGWANGCLLQGTNSPFYQTLGGNALYRMDLDLNYKIKGLDNFNLNKIMFGYNPNNGQGTINFVDSVNVFNIYTYDSGFSLANSGNYYKGDDYGLSSEFPYYITLIINGGVSVRDFTILSYFTTPTTIKLSNINPIGGANMDNVFTLLHGTFSGVISALDFFVLPGITLITLMMIPLAIALVLAIIKVLRK